MMLTGSEIYEELKAGRIVIDPFSQNNLRPNAYNLTMSNKLLMYDEGMLDVKQKPKYSKILVGKDGYVLCPNRLYLGSTVEKFGSDWYVPMMHGRSSAARLGICPHIAAGLGDLGWYGRWTLEIVVQIPVKIYPNISICQLVFETVVGNRDEVGKPLYWSVDGKDLGIRPNRKYQHKEGPEVSRMRCIIKTHKP